MKKITIKDIAKEVGVSASAVSLVLNDKPCRISEAKKTLIRSVAAKHNYVVNQIARSMVTKKSNILGVVIPDIQNIFFASLVKSLEEKCREAGYMLLVANSSDKLDDDIRLVNMLSTHGIDGLFIVPSNESVAEPDTVYGALQRLQVPYVLIDRSFDGYDCDKALFDNQKGGYEAVKYIIERGHKKIGCVSSPLHNTNGRARLEGYMQAMFDSHLNVSKEYLYEGDYRFWSGYEAASQLVKTTTAAFVSNDMMAMGFLRYLYENNMAVPGDYSIVSYDDVAAPYLINIDLCSVRQTVTDLGDAAFDMMHSRLDKGRETSIESVLLPKLIKRNSVKSML